MRIGVIGAGLIGGSIILALNEKNYKLKVVTGNKTTQEKLAEKDIEASDDIKILSDCDMVFVCTPMNKTLEVLDKLENIVSKNTIVSDVASLKEFVMQKRRCYRFIGSHPMAGTEKSGFSAAIKDLFFGAKWILTPSDDIKENEILALKNVISATGATVLIMNPEEHDQCVALISHMPMFISQALMKSAMSEKQALILASSGFRDMTRLSMSNIEMAEDMMKMNRYNIQKALHLLQQSAALLLDGDYSQEIEKIKVFRQNMYDQNGCNKL